MGCDRDDVDDMSKIRVVIADADTLFTEHFCRFFKEYPDIEILAVESDGQSALQKVKHLHPDVVLFDLVLPGLDGISLLRAINDLSDAPATICCTRFYSDVALEAIRTYGASYLLFKPVELHTLHPVLCSCTEMYRNMKRLNHSCDMENVDSDHVNAHIRNYLVSLGIPSKLSGCSYLTEAVRLAKLDSTLMRNLSRGLYLEISRNLNSTPCRIERSMRSAISIAYHRGGLDRKMSNCPSNKEFLNYVLNNIEL